MSKVIKVENDEERDKAIVDAVRRGRLTMEEIAFTFCVSVQYVLRIREEVRSEKQSNQG